MYLSFLKIKKTIEIKGSERSLFISFRGLSCKAKPRKDYSSFLLRRKEEFRKEKGLAFFFLQVFSILFFLFFLVQKERFLLDRLCLSRRKVKNF
jgi:hypothetical protein